jgi:hypothetical protein
LLRQRRLRRHSVDDGPLRRLETQLSELAERRSETAELLRQAGDPMSDIAKAFEAATESAPLQELCREVVERAWKRVPAGDAESRRMGVVAWALSRLCVLTEAEQVLR